MLKSPYYKAFSGIASWMKMLSENWRVEHVNIYVYMYLYTYMYIYIGGLMEYISQKDAICSIWTVCPCLFKKNWNISSLWCHSIRSKSLLLLMPTNLLSLKLQNICKQTISLSLSFYPVFSIDVTIQSWIKRTKMLVCFSQEIIFLELFFLIRANL